MSNHRKDIRRKIRRTINKPQNQSNEQAIILSGLNILQTLEENSYKYFQDVLHYGPSSFVGDNWAAALIWFRQKGYHEYKTITLFGVWAITEGDKTSLLMGTKHLNFTAPVFNPESYMQLIKHNFQTHYKDDGRPPPDDDITLRVNYDAAKRLALRQEIKDAIIQWMRNRR